MPQCDPNDITCNIPAGWVPVGFATVGLSIPAASASPQVAMASAQGTPAPPTLFFNRVDAYNEFAIPTLNTKWSNPVSNISVKDGRVVHRLEHHEPALRYPTSSSMRLKRRLVRPGIRIGATLTSRWSAVASHVSLTAILALMLIAGPCLAVTDRLLNLERAIKAAEMVSPQTSELFGDEVSLYNGSTTFRAIDIDRVLPR